MTKMLFKICPRLSSLAYGELFTNVQLIQGYEFVKSLEIVELNPIWVNAIWILVSLNDFKQATQQEVTRAR